MKINKQTNNISKTGLTALITIFFVSSSVAAYYYVNREPAGSTDEVNYSEPTDAQKKAGDQAKKQTIENDTSADASSPPTVDSLQDPKLQGNDTTRYSQDSSIKTKITAATVEDGTLYIRNTIDGIYQQGSCKLTLTKGSRTVAKTAGIQALPQSSTCKGFNIPTAELSNGIWNITITITINGKTGSATGSVEV